MSWRCFRKMVPNNPVRLPNGASLKFDTVDNVVGYAATRDTNLQAFLEQLVRSGQYGLTEIPEAEYHEFLEKKRAGLRPNLNREEFSAADIGKLALQAQQQADAAGRAQVNTSEVRQTITPSVQAVTSVVTSVKPPEPAPAPTTAQFTPTTGRRRPKSPPKEQPKDPSAA